MRKKYLKLAVNIPSILLGIAKWFSIAWIEGFINPVLEKISEWTHIPMLVIEGIIIGVIFTGSLWWMFGYSKDRKEEHITGKFEIKDIVPTLERMDSMLREKAIKESKKRFNRKIYIKINEKVNTEVFGVNFDDVNTYQDAKREFDKKIPEFVNRTIKQTRPERFKMAEIRSGVLDAEGFGLKQYKAKGKYKNLMNSLTILRSNIIDELLNRLIGEHIRESEIRNNMLLDKERVLTLKATEGNNEYGINDFIHSQLIAAINNLEQASQEKMIHKREAIGKRIERLELKNIK